MSEVKDPAIKLFGKTIQLLPDEKPLGGELAETKQEDVCPHPIAEELISEDPKTPSADGEIHSQKTKEDPSETNISEEKTLKKPDKILPCPRCNSMDTKFCYYNNYNVNQPRHFCKSCQRYWTAGGTMRNVPVGSGRRKNKSSPSSHFQHIMVPEALQPARSDGGILTFGSDAPLCDTMASALNLVDKSQNCVLNEFQGHERRNAISCGRRENEDVYLKRVSSTISNPAQKGNNGSLQESVLNNFQGSPPQLPCFPAPPWPSPWNQWNSNSPMPPPAFGPSGFPVSFYPVPHYWGCTLPSPWNMPWPSPQSPEISAFSSSPNSPNLGKHSRDGHVLQPANSKREEVSEEKDSEKGVLIPKTLRINDPSEAAKSSIWSTLGIKNEKTDPINGRSLFKGFQPKGSEEKNHIAETSPVLQANPAALSRSLNFHEST